MKRIRAFSPGHITGFFQICDESESPLEKGSRGAGVSVSKGVTTTVEIAPADNSTLQITINGKDSSQAPVSKAVVAHFLKFHQEETCEVWVSHKVELPIGSGFGTSGAAALSLAIAMNEAADVKLSQLEASQIAHIVEVEQRTGLGTVIAEMVGGIEIRTTAGGPGIGQVEKLPSSDKFTVVCLPFGPIATSKQLSNPSSRKRINERGGLLTDALRANPRVSNLMEYSRNFAEYIGIITKRVKTVLEAADAAGFTCSTAIFGENVFSIVPHDEVPELAAIFEHHKDPELDVLTMDIDSEGARIIDE